MNEMGIGINCCWPKTSAVSGSGTSEKMDKYTRYMSIDLGKGAVLLVMLVLEFMFRIPENGPVVSQFLSLHSGIFFLFSGFGNACSILNQLERGNSFLRVVVGILCRGFVLIFFADGMKAHFKSFMFQAMFHPVFGGEQDLKELYVNEWKSSLFNPDIVAYIGMTTMVNGLVFLAVLASPWGFVRRLKVLMGFVVLIFLCTFGLRRGLDAMFCNPCVAYECVTVSRFDMFIRGMNPPNKCVETKTADLSFTDVVEYDPCSRFVPPTAFPTTSPTILLPTSSPTGSPSTSPTDSPTIVPEPTPSPTFRPTDSPIPWFLPCSWDGFYRDTLGFDVLSEDSFQHLSEASRGFRMCPSDQSRDAIDCDPSASTINPLCGSPSTIEMCKLYPVYAPGNQTGDGPSTEMFDRTSASQKLVQVGTVLFFNRFGYFAYGTISMVGVIIGFYVVQVGWTMTLFKWMYVAGFAGILLGAPFVGWLTFFSETPGSESLQLASVHMRLCIGGSELVMFTLFATVVEGSARAKSFVSPKTFANTKFYRFVKRFGTMSLTVFELRFFLLDILSLIVSAMGAYKEPFCVGESFPPDSPCFGKGYDPKSNVISTLIVTALGVATWSLLLALWQLANFAGSPEWIIQKLLTLPRGFRSNVLKAALTKNDPCYDNPKQDQLPAINPFLCSCCCKNKNESESESKNENENKNNYHDSADSEQQLEPTRPKWTVKENTAKFRGAWTPTI